MESLFPVLWVGCAGVGGRGGAQRSGGRLRLRAMHRIFDRCSARPATSDEVRRILRATPSAAGPFLCYQLISNWWDWQDPQDQQLRYIWGSVINFLVSWDQTLMFFCCFWRLGMPEHPQGLLFSDICKFLMIWGGF